MPKDTNPAPTPITDATAIKAMDAVDRLANSCADAEARIQEAANRAKSILMGDEASRYIQRKPFQSVTVAFVCGYLLSTLRRR